MRVLHFSKYDRKGGASIAAYNSMLAQREIGIDACMFVGRRLGDDPFVEAPTGVRSLISLANFAVERLPFRLQGLSAADVRSIGFAGISPQQVIERIDPDLVVLHNIDGLLSIEDLPRLRRPIVWRMHDMWPITATEHYTADFERYTHGAAQRELDSLNRWTFERKQRAYASVDQMVLCPPSRWLAQQVQDSALLANHEVVVVPNGIDTELFVPSPRASSRRALNLPVDKPIILFGAAGGDRDPRKGFDLLQAALQCAECRLSDMEAQLVMFGGASSPPPVSVPCRNFGSISDRALLTQLYSAADVVVVPSRLENLSLTVLEALACGTPVLAFDIGGMPDMIEHGRTGWLAPAHDHERLADLLCEGIVASRSNPGLAKQCRSVVLERFNRRSEALQMRDLFDRLIG